MRHAPFSIPLLLILLTSGCTSLGGFCIPGLTCDTTVEETHDVIVIESLEVLPDTLPPESTVKVVAVVSNVADADAEIQEVPVHVQLYDHCSGMFTIESVDGGDKEHGDKSYATKTLLRGERAQIEWTLKAGGRQSIPVKTQCTLKVRAAYRYATKSITTLHFIDYSEMQRQISEGTYKQTGSYISTGYGPIKPYLRVEGTQPIPVSATGNEDDNKINTVLSVQVRNRGQGFLSSLCHEVTPGNGGDINGGDIINEGNAIKDGGISFSFSKDGMGSKLQSIINGCKQRISDKSPLRLIDGETTKILCPAQDEVIGKVPVESTRTVQVKLGEYSKGALSSGYCYEFRRQATVTVEPAY